MFFYALLNILCFSRDTRVSISKTENCSCFKVSVRHLPVCLFNLLYCKDNFYALLNVLFVRVHKCGHHGRFRLTCYSRLTGAVIMEFSLRVTIEFAEFVTSYNRIGYLLYISYNNCFDDYNKTFINLLWTHVGSVFFIWLVKTSERFSLSNRFLLVIQQPCHVSSNINMAMIL
jgi:hypothetical protein